DCKWQLQVTCKTNQTIRLNKAKDLHNYDAVTLSTCKNLLFIECAIFLCAVIKSFAIICSHHL
ncbi:hypothetical protein QHH03_30855, partial [Aphanizomenon sp. 202]|nr:hypothetical protein [Aphanizomenon sp. 202]